MELVAVSSPEQTDLTYTAGWQAEKPYVQHVSGWMFQAFGLRPALGRLLASDDDREHDARPVAILSHVAYAPLPRLRAPLQYTR